jgi:hypothetical protein
VSNSVHSPSLAASTLLLLAVLGSPQSNAQSLGKEAIPSDVTTVSPLVVRGMAPVPNVGEGATYFTIEELQTAAQAAGQARQTAELNETSCGGSNRGYLSSLEDDSLLGIGFFDLAKGKEGIDEIQIQSARDNLQDAADKESAKKDLQEAILKARREAPQTATSALYQMYRAELVLEGRAQDAAQAARVATEAAMAARREAMQGGPDADAKVIQAELARQTAIKAFQQAQAKALESHRRVADFQTQLDEESVNTALTEANDLSRYVSFVDAQSQRRLVNGGYSGIYAADEFKDLRLTNIVSQAATVAGRPVLRVSGKIVNTRRNPIDVPPIWAAVTDRFGTSLATQRVDPTASQPKIAVGDSRPFVFDISPVPDNTAKTVVTFAPLHRTPAEKAASGYCRASGIALPTRDPSRTDQLQQGPRAGVLGPMR